MVCFVKSALNLIGPLQSPPQGLWFKRFFLRCLVVNSYSKKKEDYLKWPLVSIRCQSLYHSLSLDESLVCLFTNDPQSWTKILRCIEQYQYTINFLLAIKKFGERLFWSKNEWIYGFLHFCFSNLNSIWRHWFIFVFSFILLPEILSIYCLLAISFFMFLSIAILICWYVDIV